MPKGSMGWIFCFFVCFFFKRTFKLFLSLFALDISGLLFRKGEGLELNAELSADNNINLGRREDST